ncbi:MAG: SGNH/GDSL hydrolase family protein [Stackebrandtia sp.]
MPAPRLRRVLTVSALAAATLTILSTPAYSADTSRYVALGDSFVAGPLVPNQTGSPAGCFRSDSNYPSLVAEQLGVDEFVDVSCSGATTEDFFNTQSTPIGDNDPQLDALAPETTLVSFGIGGNDIGFGEILLACAGGGAVDPFGTPCQDKYVDSDTGVDELRTRIAETRPKVAEVFAEIATRAPNARVVVAGYPATMPETEGCWPKVTIAEKDVPYLDGVEQDLNAMLAGTAAAAGATYVDNYQRGHDVCSPRDDRWVEGIIPTKPAFPVHPNADGMQAMATNITNTLGSHSPDA